MHVCASVYFTGAGNFKNLGSIVLDKVLLGQGLREPFNLMIL